MDINSEALLDALESVAPGQPLREGIDRIQQSGMGALIVVSASAAVLDICSGGFFLDAAFSPQRLSELAKMDGAIILAADASRIARANVHLVPDPNIPTVETGTRHRTAERVARSIPGTMVISVSESRDSISVYAGDEQHPLHPSSRLLARTHQAIQTLERYRTRLDRVSVTLSALEVEDLVTVREVATALQQIENVRRIDRDIRNGVLQLGTDGQLVALQLGELVGPIDDDRRLLLQDYLADPDAHLDSVMAELDELAPEELLDLRGLAARLGLGDEGSALEASLRPRGHRLLARIPRLADDHAHAIMKQFGSLQKILRATAEDLSEITDMDNVRADSVRDSLSRLAESSILDRYS